MGSTCGVCEEFVPDVSFYIGTARMVDSFLAVDVVTKFVKNLGTMSVGQSLFNAQRDYLANGYTPYLLAGVPWLSMPRCVSRTFSIMKANSLLKKLMSRGSRKVQPPQTQLTQLLLQDNQRRILLKQLFKSEV
jgi:hypothetical protein